VDDLDIEAAGGGDVLANVEPPVDRHQRTLCIYWIAMIDGDSRCDAAPMRNRVSGFEAAPALKRVAFATSMSNALSRVNRHHVAYAHRTYI
jgi:hypothetical protein